LKAKGVPNHIAAQLVKGFEILSESIRIIEIVEKDRNFGIFLRKYFEKATEVFNTEDIESEIAVFALFTSVAAWKGTSGIDDKESYHISELIRKAKKSIVISFGSPYILRHFKEADVLIAAYETTEQSQKAVIRCLKGKIDFKGHLPVKLNIKP
jgi:hypothetical protein